MHQTTQNAIHGGDSHAYTTDAQGALLSVITAQKPARLVKRWAYKDGEATKESAGQLVAGTVRPECVPSPSDLARLLEQLKPNQALCFGVPNKAGEHPIASRATVESGTATPGSITRTNDDFRWPAGNGWLLLDYDPAPGRDPLTQEQLLAALCDAAPELSKAAMVVGVSSSSYITNTETKAPVTGLRGQRVYVLCADARDIPRAGKALFDRLWLAGHGYFTLSKSGTLLERGPIDASVWQPCRLDFAARPVCDPPLFQQRPEPRIKNADATPLNTFSAIPDLSQAESATLKKIKDAARADDALKAEQSFAREAWIEERLAALPSDTPEAERSERETRLRDAVTTRRLWGDFELSHVSGEAVTVGQLLDDPERWHGERFADPLEPEVDKRVAWVNLRSGGKPFLYSHLHGGQRFALMRQVLTLQLSKGDSPRNISTILERLRIDGCVFERGEQLVRLSASDKALIPIKLHWLRTSLEETFRFMSFDARAGEWRQNDCPMDLASRILDAQGDWGLPKVSGVTTFPVMRPDGTVLDRPGYDEKTALLYVTDGLPKQRSTGADDLSAALSRIWEPFAHFPFENDLARGCFMAALLTTVTRAALPTAPAFLIRAFTPGTGKTLLSESLMLLTGAPLAAMPIPEGNPEEIEKRLFSKLLTGCAGMVLDNLQGVIDSAAMCAILTSGEPEGRILGASKVVRLVNRALCVLNGNNVTAGGDLFRRVLPITLDANDEAPERRSFTFDPREVIRARLDSYRGDLLAVLQAFQAAGAPKNGDGGLGSFDDWERVVRQCVCWLIATGKAPAPMADPVEVLALSKAEDPHHLQHIAILEGWFDTFGETPVKVSDLAALVRADAFGQAGAEKELAAVLCEVGTPPRGRDFDSRYFSGWLRKHKGRIVNGLRLDQCAAHKKHGSTWRVQLAGNF